MEKKNLIIFEIIISKGVKKKYIENHNIISVKT